MNPLDLAAAVLGGLCRRVVGYCLLLLPDARFNAGKDLVSVDQVQGDQFGYGVFDPAEARAASHSELSAHVVQVFVHRRLPLSAEKVF